MIDLGAVRTCYTVEVSVPVNESLKELVEVCEAHGISFEIKNAVIKREVPERPDAGVKSNEVRVVPSHDANVEAGLLPRATLAEAHRGAM